MTLTTGALADKEIAVLTKIVAPGIRVVAGRALVEHQGLPLTLHE
jgi:hypothetical protein